MTNFVPRVQSCQPLVTRPVIGIEAFKPPPMQFSMVQMAMRPPNVLGIIGLPPLPSMAHMPMFQLSARYMGKGQAWGNTKLDFASFLGKDEKSTIEYVSCLMNQYREAS